MARDVYQGQPTALGIFVLYQQQIPWLFLPVLQGGRALSSAKLAGQGDSAGLRATEEPLPGHAGTLQWLQADVHQHASRPQVSGWLYSVLFYHFIFSSWGIRGLANQKHKNLSILPHSPPLFWFDLFCNFHRIHLLVVWGEQWAFCNQYYYLAMDSIRIRHDSLGRARHHVKDVKCQLSASGHFNPSVALRGFFAIAFAWNLHWFRIVGHNLHPTLFGPPLLFISPSFQPQLHRTATALGSSHPNSAQPWRPWRSWRYIAR